LKKTLFILISISFLFVGAGSVFVFAQEQDEPGSEDHPLLSRMKNYYISGYKESKFDSYTFYDAQDKKHEIEGRKWEIEYTLKEGLKPPGQQNVRKNYINAIKKIGGTVLYDKGVTMKVAKEGKETWIDLWASSDGSDYRLTIVEKAGLVQEVVANAKSMAQDITQTGRVAIYGIYFDFNKADVKPESDPTLKEISKLLSQNANLKLFVVGHTDNVGEFNYNMKLSQARADAVVKTLTSKYAVVSHRLKSYGVGPLAPVTSNKTEEGRAKNRRVELVEQ
jgi:OmpA-OmpF porin, OOP family